MVENNWCRPGVSIFLGIIFISVVNNERKTRHQLRPLTHVISKWDEIFVYLFILPIYNFEHAHYHGDVYFFKILNSAPFCCQNRVFGSKQCPDPAGAEF